MGWKKMSAESEFILPVRVYYEDTDAGGVVYHATYLNYFERGRTELLRSLGFEQDQLIAEDDVLFAVRTLRIDYHKPARFNDEIVVSTAIRQIKKASVTFKQSLHRKGQKEILCELEVRVACLIASQLKPRAIPADIHQAMEGISAG
jgi:acyl-CoA thioester hydrolase